MATAGDGAAPYQGGGVGGKFRKRPIRRSAQATPYDRPPTARANSPSLFAKLVDPVSRLIYAGADRLFGVFRKRLPSIPAQRPPETIEEPRNGLQEAGPNSSTGVLEPSTDEAGNLTEISELEIMLKEKTFTRSEIERLTALLHSRTTKSSLDDVDEGDRAKLPSTTSHLLRLEASTIGPLNKHVEERENFHAAISTPVVDSRAFEEDVASPAELAKAYMGTRPAKVSPSTLRLGSEAPRRDSVLFNNTTILPRTPITSLVPRAAGSFKGLENGFTTPRSRGRSAIYNMARTPYYRGSSTLSQKGTKSDYGDGVASPSLTLSQPTWEHEGSIGSSKMALKRRSSVLDGMGSGGPVRRIRQKANLLSQGSSLSKHRSEFGPSAIQQPGAASQKLLLRNEPEPKASKAAEENGETSRRNSGYAFVPTKSTQMASKILEQLERLSPKEKSSGSRLVGTSEKSPTKLTSSTIHGQALGSLVKVDSQKYLPSSHDGQKSEGQHCVQLPDAPESTSKSKDKVEENGPRKFAVPRNVLSSMNGNSTVSVRDNAAIVTNTNSSLKLPAEPQKKKRAFQTSAHEDSLKVDDDNHSNGHVSFSLGENKKPGTSVVANKDVSVDASAEVFQTSALPEVRKPSLPEVDKIPEMPESKKIDDAIAFPNTDFGPPGGSVVDKPKMGFNFPTSPPSSSNNQSAVVSQSTPMLDRVSPQKEPAVFPTFGTSTKNDANVPPFLFSANKPNTSLDAKPLGSTSLFNSASKTDQAQFAASNKDDNGNAPKLVTVFGKSESSFSASPPTASATGIFSFGASTKNSSITNGAPSSTPSIFASSTPFPAPGSTNTNKLFSSNSSNILSSSTTAASSPSTTTTSSPSTTTTSTSSSVFRTSGAASAPAFGFGSAIAPPTSASAAPASMAEAPGTSATKDNEPKSNIASSSPFATSTTSDHSQGSLFNSTSGFQANTQAFKFDSVVTETHLSTSGSSLFGSSAPSFGVSSTVGSSSDTKSGSSTTNVFGSGFSSAPSFGLTSAVASSDTKFGSSTTTTTTTTMFGSGFGSTIGSPSTTFAFGASSTSTPSATTSPAVFGSSTTGASMFSFTAAAATNSSQGQSIFGNSTPVFGAATVSPNNNDQMSMEDSMAEDNAQTPGPSVPSFGQAPGGSPGFMFGSGTPTPATVPFQFGAQPPAQNPFQASGSVEFNAGGSFSLGSGGGDKSGRRILRVKSKNRRK